VPSAKPTQPPAFDATAHEKVLDAELKKDDGSSYAVFQDKSFPRWKRWVGGEGPEYDGTGLRDVVNANALYLDEVKNGLDAHKDADAQRHQTVNQRLTALEAQATSPPFPV
jgi:hypothetical protein